MWDYQHATTNNLLRDISNKLLDINSFAYTWWLGVIVILLVLILIFLIMLYVRIGNNREQIEKQKQKEEQNWEDKEE